MDQNQINRIIFGSSEPLTSKPLRPQQQQHHHDDDHEPSTSKILLAQQQQQHERKQPQKPSSYKPLLSQQQQQQHHHDYQQQQQQHHHDQALRKLKLVDTVLFGVFKLEGRIAFEKAIKRCIELSHNRFKQKRYALGKLNQTL